MSSQHDSVFTINDVEYSVEWEMDCGNPIWNIEGEDTCNAPNLPESIQDAITEAILEYMEDWYRGMDDYS